MRFIKIENYPKNKNTKISLFNMTHTEVIADNYQILLSSIIFSESCPHFIDLHNL